MVEMANRIGQLETNIVTERTERTDAEHRVPNFTEQLQTVIRNPTTQALAQLTWLIDAWDERYEELSSVGNFCHERGLDCRPAARQALDFALLAHDDATGTALDFVGNVGEDDGLKAWTGCP